MSSRYLGTEQDHLSRAVRASNDERQRVIEELSHHCAEGRLTIDEFSERLNIAYEARTLDELDSLIGDLPKPAYPAERSRRGGAGGTPNRRCWCWC